ncbi:beta-1,4-N-acetylgalactosaminyltransferase bre-4 [Hyalella azteca]|uniref:Beta-1,4-N-acetylgalactosaminyltransferase bre-4 n=1 Tax=Hyalella azteca TaxID=294128 RepID=A0A8B7PNL2_HYAAZ|nr:beta-1,4-N-acetylgalactosaminyltransferase bre-4 [Hyalella azteca]
MMYGPASYSRGTHTYRSVGRGTGGPDKPHRILHRQLPSAITHSCGADDPYQQVQSYGWSECSAVLCGCCSPACCSPACYSLPFACCRCLGSVGGRQPWKVLVLLLLVLTGVQLYTSVASSRRSSPLFTVNLSSPAVVWDPEGLPHFKGQQGERGSEKTSPSLPSDHNDLRDVKLLGLGGVNNSVDDGPPAQLVHMDSQVIDHSLNHSTVRGDGRDKNDLRNKKGNNLTGVNNLTGKVPHMSLLSDELPACPPVPPLLGGPVAVDASTADLLTEERRHPELLLGGKWRPLECQSRHKVAIIIPYRSRAAHLAILLRHLHPFLQKQQLDYSIFVVEQAGNGKFNRAMLLNIGALESVKLYPYECFIFHDIDLLPEDARNLYTCPQQPRHMSVAIDTMQYRLPYNDIFGGVSALSVEHLRKVNGFSNKFWGWGGEDDDMSNRIKFHGLYISRYPANIARYTMLSHKKQDPNPQRYQALYSGKKRFSSDGLNSVKYRVLDVQLRRLFTWIYVEPLKS